MNDTPGRQNSQGHLCPSWCTVDHDERVRGIRLSYHGNETPIIHTPSGYAHASAFQDGRTDDEPTIALTCRAGRGSALVDVRYSDILAAFVELLAAATPDQIRELAAAIRQAAADITGGN